LSFTKFVNGNIFFLILNKIKLEKFFIYFFVNVGKVFYEFNKLVYINWFFLFSSKTLYYCEKNLSLVNWKKIKLQKCFTYFFVNVCKSFYEFYKLVHIILIF